MALVLSKKTYRLIALAGLGLAAVITAWLGPRFAALLQPLDPDVHHLLAVLGWALAALVSVLALAVLIWPLRRAAGFPGLTGELAAVREHGLQGEVARARLEQERARTTPEGRRKHHGTMALVGALLSVGLGGLAWGMLADGWLFIYPLAGAVVAPVLTVYHAIKALAAGRQARS